MGAVPAVLGAPAARQPGHFDELLPGARSARPDRAALPWTIGLVGTATRDQLRARHAGSASRSPGAAAAGWTGCCPPRPSSRPRRTSSSPSCSWRCSRPSCTGSRVLGLRHDHPGPRVRLAVHLQRARARGAAGGHDRARLDGRLDHRHAQHDDHHDGRGLRPAGRRPRACPRTRVVSYAARNAILPSVAGFSLAIGFVVSGALLTEIVFSYPGVGYLLFQAVLNHDYPLLQGIFLVITFAVLAGQPDRRLRLRVPRPARPAGGLSHAVPTTWPRRRAARRASPDAYCQAPGSGCRAPPRSSPGWPSSRSSPAAVFGPWIAPYDPTRPPPTARRSRRRPRTGSAPPNLQQDVLSQLLAGARARSWWRFMAGAGGDGARGARRRDRGLPRRLARRPAVLLANMFLVCRRCRCSS